ncbi:hypothetical protein [Prochlorococcus sp. MIT 1307]|nr:hypothetical protein [Prochlorococcus sp. MIT 1307]
MLFGNHPSPLSGLNAEDVPIHVKTNLGVGDPWGRLLELTLALRTAVWQ